MALYGIARASTVVAILLAASSASPALADATNCFTLENKTATVANDVTVTFRQPIVNPKDGINTVGKGDLFAPPTYASPPSTYGLKWETPAQGSGPIMIGMGGTFTFCASTSAGALQIDKSPNLTYFTSNGKQIKESVKVVSADINLSNPGGTAVVTVSNPTSDVYQFLSNIEIWTGLSESAAESYALSWTSPGTPPNFTPPNVTLSPGSSDPITLGPWGGNYDLILYNFAFGSSANPSLATSIGISSFSGTVPETSTWAMLLLGFAGLGLAARFAPRTTKPAKTSA
jgi:hypothetical protein